MSTHVRLIRSAEGIDARGERRKHRKAPAHRQAQAPCGPNGRRSARRGRRKPLDPRRSLPRRIANTSVKPVAA
jgi:hypothetical protein